MNEYDVKKPDFRDRKGEKGAAMVTVLLISFLLLVASAGLLLEVTVNTANVTDATAEQQAYNAAESGIQATLNVLRRNTTPSPLIDSTKPATDPVNLIDFKKAITLATSNNSTDTANIPRLSRWLNYNYTSNGSSRPDRVVLGDPAAYTQNNGLAYKVEVKDPDNTGTLISYYTTGRIDGNSGGKTFNGSSGNTITITYEPKVVNDLNVASGMAVTDFGSFRITGTSATIVSDVRFEIEVRMTKPYKATRVIRGFIKPGSITNSSVGTVKFDFDSKAAMLMGSKMTLDNDPLTPNPPNLNGGVTPIRGEITQAEPIRILVKTTGYGPRGARKELEAVVQRNFFNGMTAPATLTLVGPPTGFVFNPGSSTNTEYSGNDVVSDLQIPPIGTTNGSNLQVVQNSVKKQPPHPYNGKIIGTPSNILPEIPTWLESAENLDATIQALKNVAQSSGRYYTAGQTPPNFGDNANAKGITFVDGDVSLKNSGGGILVVTGILTLHGNFDFNGLIICTGAGGIIRSGGGNGSLQGNIVVAPYNPSNLAAGFLPPKYDLSGGGTSDVTYNSSSLANGLTAVSNFVLGVAEK